MKATLLEVLMNLFHNNIQNDELPDDSLGKLFEQLKQLDESLEKVSNKRLKPLPENKQIFIAKSSESAGQRAFTIEEQEKLDLEARGLIIALGNLGLLNEMHREHLINLAMSKPQSTISSADLQSLVMIQLETIDYEQHNLQWLKFLMNADSESTRH